MDRSPITDPQPGDVIQQNCGTGRIVKVTARDGDSVSWVSSTPKRVKFDEPNSWSLKGWTNAVCQNATVLKVSATDAGEDENGY